jgi:ATP-dependent Clp protease ATP-binding subunit ClpA
VDELFQGLTLGCGGTLGAVFERFTERARQVVVFAQDEARALKHNYIGTEHILLGLLREEEGLAARVLETLDITVEEARAQVAQFIGQGDEVATGQIPFTPRAKKALELSLREALALGHNYIGTEHVLLGLVRETDGVAVRILLDFDADPQKVRNEVIRMLSGADAPSLPAEPAPPVPEHPVELREWPRSGVERSRGFGTTVASAPTRLQLWALALQRWAAAVVAAVGFPLGLLVGWLIWG